MTVTVSDLFYYNRPRQLMSQRLVVLVPNEKNTLRHVLFLCYDFKTNTQTHTHLLYSTECSHQWQGNRQSCFGHLRTRCQMTLCVWGHHDIGFIASKHMHTPTKTITNIDVLLGLFSIHSPQHRLSCLLRFTNSEWTWIHCHCFGHKFPLYKENKRGAINY